MNNEPVAWIDEQGEVFSNPLSAIRNKAKGKIIPLYTHLVKEKGLPLSSPSPMNQACLTRSDNYITDEEIWAVASDYFAVKSHYVTDFARAILRKASEK